MGAKSDRLRAFRHVLGDLGGADLLALAGVVLRAVVEERSLRLDLDHWQGLQIVVADDRDGELAARDPLLHEHARVRSRWLEPERLGDRLLEVLGPFHDRRADARSARHRLHERRKTNGARGLEIVPARSTHDGAARDVDAVGAEDRLRHDLVHREG